MKESNTARLILLAASKAGSRLFLNPRGQGWVGHLLRHEDGLATIRAARKVTFGVGPDGAGDALGWTPVTITPEMIGQTVAVFTSLEFKREKGGVVADDQRQWAAAVTQAGGKAGIVRTVEEALAVLRGSS